MRIPVSWSACVAVALVLLVSARPSRASAQPEVAEGSFGIWNDGSQELAHLEVEIELARHERPEDAITLLERVADERLAGDEETLTRLIRLTTSTDPPDSQPGYFYVGVPLLALGAAGIVGTLAAYAMSTDCSLFGLTPSCDPQVDPFIAGFVVAGIVFVTGLALLVYGLVTQTFDPSKRTFMERRRGVSRRLEEQRRELSSR